MFYLKNNPIILFAFLFSALILSSCSDLDNQIDPKATTYSINELENDDRFIHFLAVQHELTSNIVDLEAVNSLLGKGQLNKEDQKALAISFGFNSYETFSQAMIAQKELITDINQDYNLSSISNTILEEKIEFIFNDTPFGANTLSSAIASPAPAPTPAPAPAPGDWCRFLCHVEVGACITAAAAAATAGLLACPETGPAAPACIAAVLTAQAAAEALCLVNYTRCLQDCYDKAEAEAGVAGTN